MVSFLYYLLQGETKKREDAEKKKQAAAEAGAGQEQAWADEWEGWEEEGQEEPWGEGEEPWEFEWEQAGPALKCECDLHPWFQHMVFLGSLLG